MFPLVDKSFHFARILFNNTLMCSIYVCEVRIRLRIWTERISHAEALSEAVVNSSSLLVRCLFVGDSRIFVTNITLFDSRLYCGCLFVFSCTGRRK